MNYCIICNTQNDSDCTCSECGYCSNNSSILNFAKLADAYHKAKRTHWSNAIKILANAHKVLSKSDRRWSQANSAKALGISNSSMSLDLSLYHGIVKYPELNKCNSADEARKSMLLLDVGRTNTDLNYEKELQRKLIENWNNFELLKEWILVEQYIRVDDKNIIDVLARHNADEKWLVIELKRKRASDNTVGQILRYMGIIKETKKCQNVFGAIVSHDPDNDIYYAIQFVPNVFLWVYEEHGSSLKLNQYDKSIKPSDIINTRELSRLLNKLSPEQVLELIQKNN